MNSVFVLCINYYTGTIAGYDPYFYFLRAQNGIVRSSPFKRVAGARYLDFINRFFSFAYSC